MEPEENEEERIEKLDPGNSPTFRFQAEGKPAIKTETGSMVWKKTRTM